MKKHISAYGKIFAMITVVTLCVCACNFRDKKTVDAPVTDKPKVTENGDNNASTDSPSSPNNGQEESNGQGSATIGNTEQKPGNGDVGNYIPPSQSTPPSGKNHGSQTATVPKTDLNDPALSSYWDMLDEVVAVGQDYYTENFSKTRIISKNGYLYNKASNEMIDVKYLVANGYISSKYLTSGIEVLLLDCADFYNYDDFKLKSSESGLTVFASIKHPTKNAYLMSTNRSAGGVISASQYAALMNGYYQNHGAIGRLYEDTEEYGRMLNFISMYESRYEDYFVRSITTDNKYAMVVLSGKSNAADIKQYILRRNGSIWEVVVSGLETDPRVIVTVNKELPDFNLNMVPSYTINDYRNSISNDKTEIINEMISKGFVGSREDIKYICGTNNFCYILLKNEIKYICNNTGSGWNIVQAASSDDAYRKMISISESAPTFIILDR